MVSHRIPSIISPDLSIRSFRHTVRRPIFIAFVAILVAVALARPALNVIAAEEIRDGFRVSATRTNGSGPLIYDLTPGRLIRDEITLFNDGSSPAEVVLYAADGHTAANGGIAVGARHSSPSALGAWISLPLDSLLLAPGEKRTVTFTLRVPRQALPYKMAAGIVVEPVAPVAVGTSAISASVLQRSAVLVLGTVPGELVISVAEPAVTAKHSKLIPIVEIGIRNTGSHYVFPTVHAELRNADGATVSANTWKLGMVLPGDSLKLRMPLSEDIPSGDYTYKARVDFGGDSVTSVGIVSLGTPEQAMANLIRAWLIEFVEALRVAFR